MCLNYPDQRDDLDNYKRSRDWIRFKQKAWGHKPQTMRLIYKIAESIGSARRQYESPEVSPSH